MQIIRTAPGVDLVSSVSFMLLPERVYCFGDCAVNIEPTAEELATIALSSAHSAAALGQCHKAETPKTLELLILLNVLGPHHSSKFFHVLELGGRAATKYAHCGSLLLNFLPPYAFTLWLTVCVYVCALPLAYFVCAYAL